MGDFVVMPKLMITKTTTKTPIKIFRYVKLRHKIFLAIYTYKHYNHLHLYTQNVLGEAKLYILSSVLNICPAD